VTILARSHMLDYNPRDRFFITACFYLLVTSLLHLYYERLELFYFRVDGSTSSLSSSIISLTYISSSSSISLTCVSSSSISLTYVLSSPISLTYVLSSPISLTYVLSSSISSTYVLSSPISLTCVLSSSMPLTYVLSPSISLTSTSLSMLVRVSLKSSKLLSSRNSSLRLIFKGFEAESTKTNLNELKHIYSYSS
jgi:hypothetical protein